MGSVLQEKHAEYMAKHFTDYGIKAVSVVSNPSASVSMDRNESINKLQHGEVNVIFSVDMFNEGLDVPAVDMVMFFKTNGVTYCIFTAAW